MPTDPLKATPGTQGWRKDNAGMMIPFGQGGGGAKWLLQLPKGADDIAPSANVMIRGNFSSELWPILSMLSTIAGPNHQRTQMFIDNVTAGSMAQHGRASKMTLMAITQMLAQAWLESGDGNKVMTKPTKNAGDNHNGKVADDTD